MINRNYQRSDSVWPDAARSFLIESILLGYPIPKWSIRQMTDVQTRSMRSEIVDGQQRTKTIVDFYENLFALSRHSEVDGARGYRYNDLPDELKEQFLSFSIQADVLTGARDEEIIELFRRINSHNVSLNKEEQRHARFQGGMKWFVYKVANDAAPVFKRCGVFSTKQFARMADAKLIAEIIHAVMYGVSTTTAEKLDSLYSANNALTDDGSDAYFPDRPRPAPMRGSFPGSVTIKSRFDTVWQTLSGMDGLAGSSMMKPFNVYALVLAIMHACSAIDVIPDRFEGSRGLLPSRQREEALLRLAEVMDLDDDDAPRGGAEKALWDAASKSTNTADHRLVRFAACLAAVSQQ